MNIKIEKKYRKVTYHNGQTEKREYYEISFKDILVRKCGCGGIPKLSQENEGSIFYNYRGENVTLSCDKCGICYTNRLNPFYYDAKLYQIEMKKIVVTLIQMWNNALGRNSLEEVEYKIL